MIGAGIDHLLMIRENLSILRMFSSPVPLQNLECAIPHFRSFQSYSFHFESPFVRIQTIVLRDPEGKSCRRKISLTLLMNASQVTTSFGTTTRYIQQKYHSPNSKTNTKIKIIYHKFFHKYGSLFFFPCHGQFKLMKHSGFIIGHK